MGKKIQTPNIPDITAINKVLFIFLIFIITWVSHFWFSNEFGVYEDDLHHIVPYMDITFPQLIEFTKNKLLNPLKIGRPLGEVIPAIITFTGMKLGGFHAVYVLAYLIIACNALILYLVLLRTFNLQIAFSTVVLFCLFPADMTKPFLTHCLQLQGSMLFGFLALYLYVIRHRFVPYLLFTLCLFYYESGIIPFVAAPFFIKGNMPLSKKKIAIHWAILFFIIIIVFILRAVGGDPRMGSHSHVAFYGIITPAIIVLRILGSMIIGPFISLAAFPYGALKTIYRFDAEVGFAIVLGTILIASYFYLLPFSLKNQQNKSSLFKPELFKLWPGLHSPKIDKNISRAFWIGLFMISTGYILSFNKFPLFYLWGRGSRVHFGAAFGGAILGGACLAYLIGLCRLKKQKIVFCLVLGFSFGIFVGYGFVVQKGFIQSWENKKWFWNNVVTLCPDIKEDTRVFVIDNNLPKETNEIHSFRGWETTLYFRSLFVYPLQWNTPPRLYIMDNDWTNKLKKKRGRFYFKDNVRQTLEPLTFKNLIVLKIVDHKLIRCDSPLTIKGEKFNLKYSQSNIADFKKRPLYKLMIDKPFSANLLDFQKKSFIEFIGF